VTYKGTWYPNSLSAHSGSSAVLATDSGSRATFSFNGTGANWIAYRDEWSGIANVYVDGALKGQVDTFASPSRAQVRMYSVTGLAAGSHTLAIEATGQKSGASGGAWVWVDAFEAISAGGTTPPPSSTSPVTGGTSLTSSGDQALAVGSAVVTPPGTTAPSGIAIVSYRPNGVLISEAGVPASPPVRRGRIYAEISGPVDTGLAIANPNNSVATVSFFFTDANGVNSQTSSLTLGAHAQLAAFLDESPYNGTSPMNGTFTFTSDVPVSAIAIRGLTNERSEFIITTLPVADLDQTTPAIVFFPHFANGGGWSTQFVLVNSSDATITGTLRFFEQGNTGATANPLSVNIAGQSVTSTTYSIPPRSSRNFATSENSSTVQVGTAQVTPDASSAAPVGVAIFSSKQGGVTNSEAGVPSSQSGTAFRMYVESSGDGTVRSGIAVMNTSNAEAQVNFELTRLDGVSTGLTGSVVLPARGQRALFLDEIPGLAALPKPFKGIVRVHASNDANLAVVGLRGNVNERSDFLLTTTAPSNESHPAASSIVFPHVVDGGGYTTQFILFSGTSAEPANSPLNLFSQTGGNLNFSLN
jgi:hypothetical protein